MRTPTVVAEEADNHVIASNAAGMPANRALLDALLIEFMLSVAYCLAAAGLEVDTEAMAQIDI